MKWWVVAVVVLYAASVTCQNVTLLEELCYNHGNPIHISMISLPTKGHINPLLGLGQQLAKLGCRVTVPIVETKLHWIKYDGIEAISVPLREGEYDDLQVEQRRNFTTQAQNVNVVVRIFKMLFSDNTTNPQQAMTDLEVNVVRHLLAEHAAGRYNPDIIISERLMAEIVVDFADFIHAKFVSLHPSLYFGTLGESEHYVPGFGTNFPQNMTYFQRVLNYYVIPELIYALSSTWLKPLYDARELLGFTEALNSPEHPYLRIRGLELIQSCWGLDYVQPVLPNVHMIGPILPLELKPIPQEILDWIDQDDRDIVYMCMGTIATITPEMVMEYFTAFTDAPYRVLWSLSLKERDVLEGLTIPSNVRLEPFVPQRELLLLEKVKVFISHTGASSAYEALTSGTPVVCMPFFGDQLVFCSRIESAGSGFFLDKDDLHSDDIREKVNRALTDPKVAENAKKMQRIMDCGGSLKAADLVIRSFVEGTDHLTPNFVNLPWYQAHAFDLRVTQAVFWMILPFAVYFAFKLLRKVILCCFCRNKKSKVKQD